MDIQTKADVARAMGITVERQENARSIMQIPFAQLPLGPARTALIRKALGGAEVYAYTPHGSDRYLIRDRQPSPAVESRFSPEEWSVKYGVPLHGPSDESEAL